MSQRLVTTDDHSGAEIVEGISESGTTVSISRNGQTITWEGVNLTDESWGQLSDLLSKFLPNVTPDGCEPITPEPSTPEPTPEPQAPTAEPLIAEQAAQREASTAARQAQTAQRHGGRSNGKPVTQAEQRARSKATREWWYKLSAQELKALGLPAPRNRNSFIGKLPQAVTDVYATAQA